MTVTNQTNKITYTGNGATTNFPFAFRIDDEDYLVVTKITIADGTEVVVPSNDYTLNGLGDDNGGSIDYAPAISSAFQLQLERTVPYIQSLDISQASGFNPEALEAQLDLMTMADIQLDNRLTEQEDFLDEFEDDIDTILTALADIDASVDAAAASAASAAASASAASLSENIAEGFAEDAEDAYEATLLIRDQVITIAGLSGPYTVFATKALANAGLAGVTANSFIQVLVDESRGNAHTIYQKSGGIYVYITTVNGGVVTVYCDSNAADDTGNGLTPTTPKKLIASAVALMTVGSKLLLAGGSRFHKAMTGMPTYCTLDRYGSGLDPIIDQSRAIAAGAWTVDPDNAGVYFADVTHEVITVAAGNGDATSTQFRIYEERPDREAIDMAPYYDAADIAANRAFIAASTAGLMTNHKQGSSQKNPRTIGEATTLIRYYVKPSDGLDPTVDDVVYYYNETSAIADLRSGATVRNITFQRCGGKDATGHNGFPLNSLENCRWLDISGHAWVGGALLIRNCYVKALRIAGSYTGAFGGIHCYLGSLGGGSRIENCEVDGFQFNYYAHASALQYDNDIIYMRNNISRNARAQGVSHGQTRRGTHIDGFISINDAGTFRLTTNSKVKRVRAQLAANSTFVSYDGPTLGRIDFEDIEVNMPSTGNLAVNATAQETSNASHECSLYFTRLSRRGGSFNSSTLFKRINYVFADSIIGDMALTHTTTVPWLTLVATNSQLAWFARSLQEIQATAAGVANSCYVPWYLQSYSRTVIEDDLLYTSTTSNISASNAGDLTEFTGTAGAFVPGDQIKVTDPLGGGDVIKRVIDASGTTYHVDSAFGGTFATKATRRAYWARKIFPEGTTGLTAVLSNDGTQAYLSSEILFTEDMIAWFGALDRRTPFGTRKLDTLTAQTATFDRVINWRKNPVAVTYTAFGGSGNVPRPSIEIRFGYPIRGVLATGFGPQYRNVYKPALSLADRTGEEGPSTGGVARFTNNTTNLLIDGTSGTAGQIRHELGYIQAGFNPIGVDDVLTVSAVVWVDEFDAVWEGNPDRTGQLVLQKDSLLASLGMGAKNLEMAL
jgi:hypothetical protein